MGLHYILLLNYHVLFVFIYLDIYDYTSDLSIMLYQWFINGYLWL